jgi:hypothetical protein
MNDQRGTVDGSVHQVGDPPNDGSDLNGERGADLSLTPLFDPPFGGRPTTNPDEPTEEAPAASLVGSLSVLTLSDVLSLLASTSQTGELQVVSDSVDGRLWLEDGQFSNAHVGAASTIGQAVFELACVTEGWFYFTAGLTSSSGQPTVPVNAVLEEVRPQVDEWLGLRSEVPLEAMVALSPTPPGQDVQIRSDQWQVLTTVGNAGYSVKTVIDLIGGDQIAGLRTLRDLRTAGLIVLEMAPSGPAPAMARSPFTSMSDDVAPVTVLPSPSPSLVGYADVLVSDDPPPPPPDVEPVVGNGDQNFRSLAEVAIMPPPIAGDPWAPTAPAPTAETNGSGDHGVA